MIVPAVPPPPLLPLPTSTNSSLQAAQTDRRTRPSRTTARGDRCADGLEGAARDEAERGRVRRDSWREEGREETRLWRGVRRDAQLSRMLYTHCHPHRASAYATTLVEAHHLDPVPCSLVPSLPSWSCSLVSADYPATRKLRRCRRPDKLPSARRQPARSSSSSSHDSPTTCSHRHELAKPDLLLCRLTRSWTRAERAALACLIVLPLLPLPIAQLPHPSAEVVHAVWLIREGYLGEGRHADDTLATCWSRQRATQALPHSLLRCASILTAVNLVAQTDSRMSFISPVQRPTRFRRST